jgi:protein phosphatase 2C family protein 2/3
VASYSEKELYKKIMNSPAFYKARYRDAIRCGYYAIDEDLRRDPDFNDDNSGCTAVVALVTKEDMLYVVIIHDFYILYMRAYVY